MALLRRLLGLGQTGASRELDRETAVGAKYLSEIRLAARTLGEHEGVSEASVLAWLCQFRNEDLPLAVEVLKQVSFITRVNVRAFTQQLVDDATALLGDGDVNNVVFVPMARVAGGGADAIARAAKTIAGVRVVASSDLTGDLAQATSIVFLDDFSGTGNSATEWWATNEPLVRPLGLRVGFGTLVMTTQAQAAISGFATPLPGLLLTESANVLGAASPFSEEERRTLENYCRATGCSSQFVKGYGDSGLLVALPHGCPNNSLPILWWDGGGWVPLFKRRGL